ncbi:MAG: choice-of-anchor B family protein, partial [Ignavibacteriaceae bacterium]|nr:choice-of-anchor B family protein [Ignavibacteriaceae bacterium]
MKKVILYFLILFSVQIFGQNNVTLLSHLNQYPSAGYNDIWGYVDGTGNEYALLGVRTGTSIVNLANPQNPVEVAFIPGPQSIWRDIKVHNTYAYVVTEQTGSGQGLQIIDLSQLPTTATLVNTIDTWFTRAHNIFIDNGFAYVIGTNSGGGMHILDLSNPVNPTRTSYYTGSGYIHDVYVWNDTVVACAEDVYDIVDVTNKSNAQLISSSIALPGIYAHSGWMTEDKRYFFGTEEFNQVDITVWDLVDRTSWNLVVSSWEMPSNSTVHNLFIKGDYAHISYYSDGYVVLDISDPLNPILAGQYDTPNMWGCYPYLPSGITICSDIDDGLWVFQFEGGVPVELSSFNANAYGNFVELDWTTATETNNQGFEIQKKSGADFYTIGFVNGSGTSTEPRNYSYKDKNLENGVYVYRLKQIDFDGTSSLSEEIMVEVSNPSDFVLNQNYPNPFNPST